VFNGVDWSKLGPVLGAVADYTGRFQLAQRLSFNPDIHSTPWAGYGRSGRGTDYQLWSNLTFDGAGTAFFWYPSLLNPDFSFSPSAVDYRRSLAVLREGVGKQYRRTRRVFSPVALLWSARSQRAAWLAGKMADFVKAEADAYGALQDAGYDPFFISEIDVAAGGLEKKGARALVLPMTLSVGRGEKKGGLPVLAALKAFAGRGGLVLATHPAAFDEFLRPAGAVDLAKPFDVAALAAVPPNPALRDVDGRPVPSATVTRHAFREASEAELLTLLRRPVGQKEIIGADGVAHAVPDPSSGPPLLKVTLDVSAYAGKRFFDVRRRQALLPKDGRLSLELEAGDGRPIAVLPYDAPTLALEAARENDRLKVSLKLSARGVPHVIRLDVGGDPLLSRNLLVDAEGVARAEIALALEERGRGLEIRATDVLTGASAATSK